MSTAVGVQVRGLSSLHSAVSSAPAYGAARAMPRQSCGQLARRPTGGTWPVIVTRDVRARPGLSPSGNGGGLGDTALARCHFYGARVSGGLGSRDSETDPPSLSPDRRACAVLPKRPAASAATESLHISVIIGIIIRVGLDSGLFGSGSRRSTLRCRPTRPRPFRACKAAQK